METEGERERDRARAERPLSADSCHPQEEKAHLIAKVDQVTSTCEELDKRIKEEATQGAAASLRPLYFLAAPPLSAHAPSLPDCLCQCPRWNGSNAHTRTL